MPDHKPFLLFDPDDSPEMFEMMIFSEHGMLMGAGQDFTYARSLKPTAGYAPKPDRAKPAPRHAIG